MNIQQSSPHHVPDKLKGNSFHSSYNRVCEHCYDRDLSLREFVCSPDAPLHLHYDNLVELLGDAQHDPSEFGRWVFDEAADILANVQADESIVDNNDWSHAALYLFRAACFSPTPLRSVLDLPQSHPQAERLINRAVDFCESSHSLGTVPVIIRSVIASNIRAWAGSSDLTAFYFHPAGLRSEQFCNLLRDAQERELAQDNSNVKNLAPLARHHAVNEKFCQASSPEEFLVWAFTHQISLPVPECSPRLKELLVACHGVGGRCYISSHPGDSTPSLILPSQAPQTTLDLRRGVFVDVFGTLLEHNGAPNYRLVQVVRDLMQHAPARSVFLVSDSQEQDLARALSSIQEPLPPIIRKDTLQTSQLEYLIDNSEPEPQGLHALHHLSPDQAIKISARLVEDDAMYLAV